MMWLIAYDVSDGEERELVASVLMAAGFFRVQKSVFVGGAPRGRVLDVLERLRRRLKGRHYVWAVPTSWESRLEVGVSQFAGSKWGEVVTL